MNAVASCVCKQNVPALGTCSSSASGDVCGCLIVSVRKCVCLLVGKWRPC